MSKHDNWEKIFSVFSEAVELSEEDRKDFVKRELDGREDEIAEVLELLSSHEDAEHFLADSPATLAADALAENEGTLEGKEIGPYRLESRIGSGGMGSVYLATRADKQFEQRVAIKLLKRGMDTDAIVERFKYERQILAELNHPNIAQLLDGGATDDGLPYFVLEYIEGLSITEYCAQNDLGLNQRLALFRKVCAAVSYAHKNLIIHRDIKPSNIIVTEDGTPKLLDFGIAKVLDSGGETVNLTNIGERMMTPKYASPEQINGKRISTTSDVYSLGVLLYELIAGRLPYNADFESPKSVEEAILNEHPSLPSSETNRDSADDSHIKGVASSIKSDLDNVCLMSIEKDPTKRYGSVDEFSTDIQNYLEGRPVVARKQTSAYRFVKFIGRHRAGVAVGAFIGLLLTGFVVNSMIQSARISRERDRSEKVVAFLRDIFKGNDPSLTQGKDIPARQLFDEGVVKIETELNDQPDVQAALMDTVGLVYLSLGLFEKSDELLEKALESRKKYFGEGSPEVAETLLHLSDARRSRGNFKEANELAQQSLKIEESNFGTNSKELIDVLDILIHINFEIKDMAAAESYSRRKIEIVESSFGQDSSEMVLAYQKLADVQMNKGQIEKAEKNARAAVDISKRIFSEPDASAIEANIMLARVLFFNKGEFKESWGLLQEAEKMGRVVYGKAHPKLVWILTNKGFFFETQGNLKKAIEVDDERLEIQKKLYGEEHPLIASVLNQKAANLFNSGKLEEANKTWDLVLEMRRKFLGSEHPKVTETLSNLGLVKFEQKDYEGAKEAFQTSLDVQKKVLKPGHPQIGFSLLGLGNAMVYDGEASKAEPLIREGLSYLEKSFFKNTWFFAEAQNTLGNCLLKLGKRDEARKLLEESYPKIQKKYGDEHKKTKLAKERLEEVENALS